VNRFALFAPLLVVACNASATETLPDLEFPEEVEAIGLPHATAPDETVDRAPRGGGEALARPKASNIRVIPCLSCMLKDIWAAEESMHREVSEADQACGLRGNVLDFNTMNDPAVDFEVLRCLEGEQSHRTAWKAFLYAVHLSHSAQSPCLAVRSADIAWRTRHVARVSTYGLEPDRFQNNPFAPFSRKYRLVRLREAASLFFDKEGADVRDFTSTLNECGEDLSGSGVLSALPDLVIFFDGGQ